MAGQVPRCVLFHLFLNLKTLKPHVTDIRCVAGSDVQDACDLPQQAGLCRGTPATCLANTNFSTNLTGSLLPKLAA